MRKLMQVLMLLFCVVECQYTQGFVAFADETMVSTCITTDDDTTSENDNYYWTFDTGESNDYYWVFEPTETNAEEIMWENDCEYISSTLSAVDWINSVTISPAKYEDYEDSHEAVIVIQCENDITRTDNMEMQIECFIENADVFEIYSIQYMN